MLKKLFKTLETSLSFFVVFNFLCLSFEDEHIEHRAAVAVASFLFHKEKIEREIFYNVNAQYAASNAIQFFCLLQQHHVFAGETIHSLSASNTFKRMVAFRVHFIRAICV